MAHVCLVAVSLKSFPTAGRTNKLRRSAAGRRTNPAACSQAAIQYGLLAATGAGTVVGWFGSRLAAQKWPHGPFQSKAQQIASTSHSQVAAWQAAVRDTFSEAEAWEFTVQGLTISGIRAELAKMEAKIMELEHLPNEDFEKVTSPEENELLSLYGIPDKLNWFRYEDYLIDRLSRSHYSWREGNFFTDRPDPL